VAAASRQFDLTPAEIESWAEDGKRGMEAALRANAEAELLDQRGVFGGFTSSWSDSRGSDGACISRQESDNKEELMQPRNGEKHGRLAVQNAPPERELGS